MTSALRLAAWLMEIIAEACGTCLVICMMAFWQARHIEPPLHNDLSPSKFAGISVFILFEFAMTGYLATTLIARFALRGKLQNFYPYFAALLYLLHSSIFFIAVGNSLLEHGDLAIQLGGAFVTFVCTWLSNLFLVQSTNKASDSLATSYEAG